MPFSSFCYHLTILQLFPKHTLPRTTDDKHKQEVTLLSYHLAVEAATHRKNQIEEEHQIFHHSRGTPHLLLLPSKFFSHDTQKQNYHRPALFIGRK